jgi:outer membrane protein
MRTPGRPKGEYRSAQHEGAPVRTRVCGLVLAALALPGAAAERPLWELGLGAAALRLPHYRGSDQSHGWLLPVPYVVYRGEIFKADREGARATLLDTDRIEIDLSAGAGAPTRSRDNDARRGMADLAPTVELGPNLNWTLARAESWKLDLRLPVRAAVTLESRPRAIGWVAAPNLNADIDVRGWNLGLQAGPLFGSRRYHAYFYDVGLSDVTAARPAYAAHGGFAGARVVTALSRRSGRLWVGMFASVDSVRGARFDDSPLVRRRDNVSMGIAMSWVFAESERRVTVPD